MGIADRIDLDAVYDIDDGSFSADDCCAVLAFSLIPVW